MAQVLVYMHGPKATACLRTPEQITNNERGFEYDCRLKQVTTLLYEPPHGDARLVLQVSLDRFGVMLDNIKRFNHYLSLISNEQRIHRYRQERVTVSLPGVSATRNGKVMITVRPPDGRVSFFEQTEEVAWEKLEDILMIPSREEAQMAESINKNASAEVPSWLMAIAPDANHYADGTPKDRSRYPPQISTKIPNTTVWHDAAADAYVATIPSPVNPTNVLIALDPALAAAFLLTVGPNDVEDSVSQMIQTVEKQFDVYLDAEKLNTALTFHWWKKAYRVMQSAYRSLGLAASQCQVSGQIDYENVRDLVYVLRYHLGVMYRRTSKKPTKPTSVETDTPAWWYKEYEDFRKTKAGVEDTEKEGTQENDLKGSSQKKGLKALRERQRLGGRPWPYRPRRVPRKQEEGDHEPEVQPEEPEKKKTKVEPNFLPGKKHTKAFFNKATGQWVFS